MAQTDTSVVAENGKAVNGDTPSTRSGPSETPVSNGKKRSRSTDGTETATDSPSSNNSPRKRRNGVPVTGKTSKQVFLRDENDLDALEDDESARTPMKLGGKGKKRQSLPISGQDRRIEMDNRKERAKKLAVETATLPVNTGEPFLA
jgi:hypothetical protein